MKKISYYDPRCPELEVNEQGQNMTVEANNQDEYEAHMTAITNPEREITNVTEEDLPPLPVEPQELSEDEMNFLRGLYAGFGGV